ncbi:MAG TPA: hypothetical protein PKI19_05820, partial [Elusimicrobiales bacterium]|nr:hypothetical protein [Elusimicrobiales bacterium]
MRKLILGLVTLLSLAGAAHAVEPVMTYQGRLKEGGQPVTDVRSFDFKFCPALSGTCSLSTPSGAQDFIVQNGLFKSTFTVPAGDFSSGEWYLQVAVGLNAASLNDLSPREKLTFVPYSVYAATAGYVAGAVLKTGDIMSGGLVASTITLTGTAFSVGGSTFAVVDGRVGIGTAEPNTAATLHLYSNLYQKPLLRMEAAYSGAKYWDMFVNTGVENALMFKTDNASYPLSIYPSYDGLIGIGIYPSYSSASLNVLSDTDTGAANILQLSSGSATSPAAVLVVQKGGKVGVGTAAPQSKLDVAGGSITIRGENSALVFEDYNRTISSEGVAGLGGGLRISTNVYIVGFSSAAMYYGDGSQLTNVSAANSGAAVNFSGALGGDVTGTQNATVVGNDSHSHTAGTLSGVIYSTAAIMGMLADVAADTDTLKQKLDLKAVAADVRADTDTLRTLLDAKAVAADVRADTDTLRTLLDAKAVAADVAADTNTLNGLIGLKAVKADVAADTDTLKLKLDLKAVAADVAADTDTLKTQLDLKANDNAVVKLSGIQTVSGEKYFANDISVTGKISVPRAELAAGVAVSSEALADLGGGVRISSNVYIVGFSSAANYYGDGSGLTEVNARRLGNMLPATENTANTVMFRNSAGDTAVNYLDSYYVLMNHAATTR